MSAPEPRHTSPLPEGMLITVLIVLACAALVVWLVQHLRR